MNLDDEFLRRLDVDPTYYLIITGLIVHRHIALLVLFVMRMIGTNLSVDTALFMDFHQDFLRAVLLVVTFAPFLEDQLDVAFIF